MKRLPFKLPPHRAAPATHADFDTGHTTLGQEVERRSPDDDDLSGLKLLREGKDAFAARVLLARSAEVTLDVQYYIWHDDLSGSLMLDELEAAADRGVRVRLIVDDVGTARLDDRLACLATHSNIEVRIYNPCAIRWPKSVNYLFAFRRLNRRMHAKSFTVDSQATILGGRNIGDEYFAARTKGLFADLDVLAVGAIVPDVSKAFDGYWNGPDVRPVGDIVRHPNPSRVQKVKAAAANLAGSERAERYREAVQSRKLFGELIDGTVTMTWACVKLVTHDYIHSGSRTGPIDLRALMPACLDLPERQLDVISGYFVPTAQGTHELATLGQGGVAIRVLTNSFAATDVGFVHTGYAPRRRALLRGGVRLFEMPAPDDKPKTARKFVRTRSARARSFRADGRSLHAKAIVVDGRQVYIGSANFDPRSVRLNTEMGFLIESPALAKAMTHSFDQDIEGNVYRLSLTESGMTCWFDDRDDDTECETTEPGTSIISRMIVAALSKLPLESYL